MPSILVRTQKAAIPALAADCATLIVAASATDNIVSTISTVAGTISLLAGGTVLLGPTVLLAHQPKAMVEDVLTEVPLKTSELTSSSTNKLSYTAFYLWATSCSVSALAVGMTSLPECPSAQDQFYSWALVYLSLVGPALRIRAALLARSTIKNTSGGSPAESDLNIVVAGYSTCPYFEKAKSHADRLVASGVYRLVVQEFGSRDDFQTYLAQWKSSGRVPRATARAHWFSWCRLQELAQTIQLLLLLTVKMCRLVPSRRLLEAVTIWVGSRKRNADRQTMILRRQVRRAVVCCLRCALRCWFAPCRMQRRRKQ